CTPASENPPFTRTALSVVRRAFVVAFTRPAGTDAAFSGTAITFTEPAASAATGIARSTSTAATEAARGCRRGTDTGFRSLGGSSSLARTLGEGGRCRYPDASPATRDRAVYLQYLHAPGPSERVVPGRLPRDPRPGRADRDCGPRRARGGARSRHRSGHR